MAGLRGPGAGEVVCHHVEEVEVQLRVVEVDVAERPFAGGEGGGEGVLREGEEVAQAGEEGYVVCAFVGGRGVFPVDLVWVSMDARG